ncbi:alpha/beta fold hydrolase, partial [Streptomyces sp. NPDC059641]
MSATVSFPVPSPHGPRTVTLSYARVGDGEPLLLLHGIGHHRQAWDPVIHLLAGERDVVSVDLPGFGASPALPDGLRHDLPTMNAALGALCETLEIDRPHVAGNSLGGLLALEMGREKLARSVTALSPAGFWTEAERRYAFGVLQGMRAVARHTPLPLVERLSRTAAGRTVLTSTIYARPGRRSPESVVAETLA